MSEIKELIERLCPDGVDYKRIDSLFETFSGMTGVSDKWKETGNCRFIDYLNVYNNMRVDVKNLPYATVKNSQQNTLQKGDILLTCASETPDECAMSSVIRDDINEGIFLDDHLFAIRLKGEHKDIVNTAFLNYYMHSSAFRIQVCKKVRGVTRFYITGKPFMSLEIPVPPIEVQRKIVEILDNFTELEAELERKLEAELEARQKQYEYYRNQLLTFDDTRSDVKWMTLGEIGKCYSGATPKTGIAKYWDNGTISWMNSGEVNLGRVFKTEKKITQEGYNSCSTKMVPVHTVVIALAGQGKTRGTVAITEIELCTNQSLCAIELKKDVMDSYFLLHYLRGQYQTLRKISSGDGTRGGLNQNMIRSFIVPVPPLEEQKRIVSILDRFEALTTDLQSGLPAEIEARRKQYEYYREKLLTFKRKTA